MVNLNRLKLQPGKRKNVVEDFQKYLSKLKLFPFVGKSTKNQ